jgi:uncharacterized protein YdhG (YjbR/CyaY superfamily)
VKTTSAVPRTIDEYVAGFPPPVQDVLRKIRHIVRETAPGAEETISYRMPAFKLNGIVLYFAAFKNHIGVFPPVQGDARLEAALAPYAGPKGNLRFPLDRPIPFDLVRRIAKLRVAQNLARTAAHRAQRRPSTGKRPPRQPRP